MVATLYKSGKLVVQGRGATLFAARFLGVEANPEPEAATSSRDVAVTGSDETGKGDYFGPLVVVALRLPAGVVLGSEITDSKKLSDEACARLGPALAERFEHAIERLDPPDYNRTHAREKNLNPMLADLHARAIRRVAEDGERVVVDRFANERLVASRLEGLDVDLVQMPRAESAEPAVAAASILARHAFVEALDELSARFAVDLHKGAGTPTDAAARAFVELHGREALGEVAKLHFKNTAKLDGSA